MEADWVSKPPAGGGSTPTSCRNTSNSPSTGMHAASVSVAGRRRAGPPVASAPRGTFATVRVGSGRRRSAVRADSPRWHVVGPPAHAAEEAAQNHVRGLLPGIDPYQGWTNFTFIAHPSRRRREVDLAVLTPRRLFLVEIKSWRGRLTGAHRRWQHTNCRGELREERNPFDLADQKAKELRSRLEWAAGRLGLRVRVPFVQAAVLLSEPDLSCDLRPEERDFVYGPDRRPADGAGLPSVAELWTPNGSSPNPQSFEPVAEFGAALPALLAELGATAVPDDRSRAARVVPEAREQDDTAPIHPVDRTPEPRTPPVATRETDPWEAGPGDRLPGGAVVRAVVDAVAEVTSGSWEEDETRTLLVGAGDAQRLLRVAEAKAGAVRLEREARNLGQLAGAPTPRLLAGPHQFGGRTVLEVEFVAGPTLRDRLPAGKPLAKETLRRWGSDLLSTLEDLEAADVYHRNVTPDHIVLRHNDDREELTLIDFSQSSISLGNKGAGTLEYRGYGGLERVSQRSAANGPIIGE